MKIEELSGGPKYSSSSGQDILEEPDLFEHWLSRPATWIRTIAWLGKLLGQYSGALLIVSHDTIS